MLIPTSSATRNTTSAGANRRRRSRRTWRQSVGAEVWDERRRDAHGAVRLLVVFQQRDDRAREGDARRVQGVHELGLGTRLGPVADVGAPGLVVGEGARA